MPRSCKCIVKKLKHKGVITDFEYEKLMRNLSAEVKHGKWTEKEVIHKEEAKDIIEEWQSCRCTVCKRYDTRPYLYYFDEPHYCSWCGADMRKKGGADADS